MKVKSVLITILFTLVCVAKALACWAATAAPSAQAQPAIAKSIGAIKTINGNMLTLTPASGPDVAVTVEPSARILRLGTDKDPKNATPIQLQDLQVGDTIRARGPSSGANAIDALEIIVITRSAMQAVSDQIRQDWQKRGLGGTVSAVDTGAGTVTIAIAGFGGSKTITVHASKSTIIRRYAPDSIKFEEAKPSTLQEVQPGDQLRARGDRSADGSDFTAEEIVTGRFRNIAGTVNSVDASTGALTVQDVMSKKPVQLKITADSQLHKLPPELAQHIAMRLKAKGVPGMPGAGGNSSGQTAPSTEARQMPPGAAANGGAGAGGVGSGGPNGSGGGMRSGDLQQMLSHMPAVTLADLHKGDAVMMVATEGSSSSPSTAVTLLSGVEPILEAAPNGSQAMMLTPWSLGGAPNGDSANP